MSLSFDLSKINDYRNVCYTEKKDLHPITDAIAWYTMAFGLGELTEKNLAEWLVRLDLYDRMFGSLLTDGHITEDDLRKHFGLRSNVNNETRKSWCKQMADRFCCESDRRIRPVA